MDKTPDRWFEWRVRSSLPHSGGKQMGLPLYGPRHDQRAFDGFWFSREAAYKELAANGEAALAALAGGWILCEIVATPVEHLDRELLMRL